MPSGCFTTIVLGVLLWIFLLKLCWNEKQWLLKRSISNSFQPIPKPTPGLCPLMGPQSRAGHVWATDAGFSAASQEWTWPLGVEAFRPGFEIGSGHKL